MEFRIIIPARFNSTRLPGKVLLDIAGKPMLQHVYEKAVASGAESVVIATDHKRIAEVAEKFDAPVIMTSDEHQSGTERLSEAVDALEYDPDEIVIGLQADQPLIPIQIIRQLAEAMAEHDNVKIASVCDLITNTEDLFNPHIVKVVLTRRHYAMYFSRAPIPWVHGEFEKKNHNGIQLCDHHHYRHIGIYGYRVSFLADYMEWAASPLESIESLEQLRILWNGFRMHMCIANKKMHLGVDTPDQLDVVRQIMQQASVKD